MSVMDGVGFGGVPGGVSAAFGDLRFGGGVDRVPQDGDGLGHECEGGAALNCFFEISFGSWAYWNEGTERCSNLSA